MTIKPIILLTATLAASAAMAQQAELTPEQEEELRSFAMGINEICAVPQPPEVPGGDVTREQLREVQGEVQSFVNNGNSYLECLAEQEAELGEDATDLQKGVIAAMHNRVIDNMQAAADQFNTALKSLE